MPPAFFRIPLLLALFLYTTQPLQSIAAGFPDLLDHKSLTQRVKSLSRDYGRWMETSTFAESGQGREVWLIELGSGEKDQRLKRPAMLVIGDVEGTRLAGSDAALDFVNAMLSDTGNRSLLDSITVYVIPRLNPDASERYFESPRIDTPANLTPYDDDRDGLTDEDAADDLDGDGLIAWMRVKDPEGTLLPHPDDSRLLVEADSAKGEDGAWMLLAEGRDNDDDKQFNEDGLGGVNFNRHFTFDYPWFHARAGLFPLREPIAKALGRWFIDTPHIGAVFVFASNDTLIKTPVSADESARRVPQTDIVNEDIAYYKQLGEWYRDSLGIDELSEGERVPGAFSDWVYFHRGRLALTAAGWSPQLGAALLSANGDDENEDEKGETEKPDSRNKHELDYLAALGADSNEYFIDWTAFDHPDFPGQTVELGGWAPFARTTPPASILGEWKDKHVAFLVDLAGKLPKIGFADVQMTHLGDGVHELVVTIENTGYLPTMLKHGERTNEVAPTRLEIDLDEEAFLAGKPREFFGRLEGGASEQKRFIIKAPPGDTLTMTLISALGGTDERDIALKGE